MILHIPVPAETADITVKNKKQGRIRSCFLSKRTDAETCAQNNVYQALNRQCGCDKIFIYFAENELKKLR